MFTTDERVAPTAARPVSTVLSDAVIAVFRVVVAFLFFVHAIMPLGAAGGIDGAGSAAPAGSFAWWIGIAQIAGAVLLAVGLWTRATAFLLSGMMAGAYFLVHQPTGALPVFNGGEPAALYSWIFLLIVAIGAGRYSIDAWRSRV